MHFLEDDPIDPDCIERSVGSCKGEPFFGEHEGKRYCVLHFPGPDKKEAFDVAFERKQSAYESNYQGIWFPPGNWFSGLAVKTSLDFGNAFFSSRASFYSTTFNDKVSFNETTFKEDASFSHATFKGRVDFSSTTFRKRADFDQARFEGSAVFWRCTFIGIAEFRDADFQQTASFWPTTFKSKASFYNVKFAFGNFGSSKFVGDAMFSRCVFGGADFVGTWFNGAADFSSSRFERWANFISAKFESSVQIKMSLFASEARFRMVTFNGAVDFSHTVFRDIVSFSAERGIGGFGPEATCDFRHVRFEAPRRVSFHGLTLRPHWFLSLDPREFEFIDVKWIGQLGRHRYIDLEIEELREREKLERENATAKIAERIRELELFGDKVAVEELKEEQAEAARIETSELQQKASRFHRLLSIACRQLAVNAEENHRYDQGSDFRFWSMELQRREGWKTRGAITGILHILYRYLSGYGEKIGLALAWLVGIWLLFAVLYTQVGFDLPRASDPAASVATVDDVGSPQRLTGALGYSLGVITLQRPDPRPLTTAARSLVLLETILGPIQAALLILAVRRRFMR